jgi:DNA repair photolyase
VAWIFNEYGITLVSLNPEFKNNFEPYSAPYEIRIESLKKLHDAGLKTWVSIEPYPTPNIDPSAHDIESLLEKIGFVDKIIFGKLNYNVRSTRFKDNQGFYEGIARKVIDFCNTKGITLHIKEGTPLSELTPSKIF